MRFKSLSSVIALAVALTLQAQQPQQQQQGPKPKSKGEQEALQKVQEAAQAQNYDAELQAINSVLENYADTEYKPLLLNMAMDAAQRKGDQAQTSVYADRLIQADPNNIPARVMMAESIASHTRENDLDKDQSLKKVDDYASKALDLLKTADTPPLGMNPAQWPDYKKELTSQAYDALGQAADLRKNYPDAIKDFQAAIQAQPANSVSMARLSKAYVGAKQYDDAISTADKVLAMNDAPASVKQFAQSQKDAATKLKAAPAAK
jgi:hypothetical protein